jgi:hypothetical protein
MMRRVRSLLRQPVNLKVVLVLGPVVFFAAMFLGFEVVKSYLAR